MEQIWEDILITEEQLVDKFSHLNTVRFAYDENLKAVERRRCVNYKFLLMDHYTQGYIINKPQEKSINISKQKKLHELVQMIENSPQNTMQNNNSNCKCYINIIQNIKRNYTEKQTLENQVRMTSVKQRNQHVLAPNINLNNNLIIMSKYGYKYRYVYILEREYNKDDDYLIAGSFSDSEGSSFMHPFLMVQRKDIKISELYQILNNHFKNKKINKFFDSDIQSVISKFNAIINVCEDTQKIEKLTEDNDNTLESVVSDYHTQDNFLSLQIRIYGIDLSTNIKKITSTLTD